MATNTDKSPYLKSGRLADVIAALQAMGAGARPESAIRDWAKQLSYSDSAAEVEKWTDVFRQHPEFFLVYSLDNESTQKAALRWRYTNKLYDNRTGREYTPAEIRTLSHAERSRLTTKPLTSEAIATLINSAIELHKRALEELALSRWWVPIIAAFPGFVGAILGAAVAATWGAHR